MLWVVSRMLTVAGWTFSLRILRMRPRMFHERKAEIRVVMMISTKAITPTMQNTVIDQSRMV